MNPYMHKGARVRHRNTGSERVVADHMYGLLRFEDDRYRTFHAAHYKPVVRVKMGRCRVTAVSECARLPCEVPCTTRVCINGQWYGNLNGTPRLPDVPPNSKHGDTVWHEDGKRYANVFLGRGGLYLSPWWTA